MQAIRFLRLPLPTRVLLIFVSCMVALIRFGGSAQAVPGSPEREIGPTSAIEATPAPEAWPVEAPPAARADTFDFGNFEIRADGQPYAVFGQRWDFDSGSDPLQGWTSYDFTENHRDFWRHIDAATWAAEGNPPPCPLLVGTGLALCGAGLGFSDSLGWAMGIGYGNSWCQRLTSPPLTYDGSGSVQLSLTYFNETELWFDYSKIFVQTDAGRTELNAPGFTGAIGVSSDGTITPRPWSHGVTNTEFGGGSQSRSFRIVVEFQSDGGLSDEDGQGGWDSHYGAVAVDDVALDGSNLIPQVPVVYNFETDLSGWSAGHCPGAGSYLGAAPLSLYGLPDYCDCGMSGNIMELHDDAFGHPSGQHEVAISPILDRSDLGSNYLLYNSIAGEARLTGEGTATPMLYRVGWSYYPYQDPNVPGWVHWSPHVGTSTFLMAYGNCSKILVPATGSGGVPADAQKLRMRIEVVSPCNYFGIPCPADDFGPIFDNIRLRVTQIPNAPAVAFANGGRYQDGFNPAGVGTPDSPGTPGNADVAYNIHLGNAAVPAILGDSLSITGPNPSPTTRWEARLWWRLARMGPAQTTNATFTTWKNAVVAAKGIDFFTGPRPDFTWGYMDSCESSSGAIRSKFCSQFRDGPSSGGGGLPADLNYNWGSGGEQGEGNEILPDQCFTPGTKIEYFVTTNYTCTPGERSYLPDTTGGWFEELEMLPGWRLSGGVPKFPCVLVVDASQYRPSGPSPNNFVLDHAWNVILNGAGPLDPIPNPPTWDRYDYLETGTSWGPPFFRDLGGNNGVTVPSLMGYRAIQFSTGNQPDGLRERDCLALRLWLDQAPGCTFSPPAALLLDGNYAAKKIATVAPTLLRDYLGASFVCSPYHSPLCPPLDPDNDANDCVRLERAGGSPTPATIPLDLFGNDCPIGAEFSVLGTAGTGIGTRVYEKVDTGTETPYAQVICDRSGGDYYRTVLNGWSYDYLTMRGGTPGPGSECPSDLASRITAIAAELGSDLRWALNIANPQAIGLCDLPDDCPGAIPDGPSTGAAGTNRLDPNRPNPFRPQTTIRFSLAAAGRAEIVVFDVQGRQVRRLVAGPQAAGAHEVVWDGRDDAGRRLPAGVYWSQLRTDGYRSNRKMLLLQ